MDSYPAGAKKSGTLNNERGAVLLTVLILLVLLTVLGVMTISTSTTEVELAGNSRRAQLAFYTADAAVEYAITSASIYETIGTGSWSSTVSVDDGNSNTPDYTAQARVDYLSSGPLPPGSGSDTEVFQGNYYAAAATGHGPASTEANIETQVARVVPAH